MKLIVAIIRPEELEQIRAALDEPGVSLACISQAQLIDERAPCSTATYRGVEIRVPRPRLRLEVVVANDALVSWTMDAIVRAARGGGSDDVNDPKLFVVPLDEPAHVSGRKPQRVAA
jgi:nitrogen regulatory protein P-II 1